MYSKQGLNSSPSSDKHDEEYEFNNTGSEQKYIVNWSPQEGNTYFSKHRFASPRVLSKSVPRRNKMLFRYRINRSLNFDSTYNKHDNTFKSPSSGSDSSCYDGEKQLTRSAKIMKALNFDCSPLHKHSKKIKKSLNFDLNPSPKRFSNLSKSSKNGIDLNMSPSPKFNKRLNFETSSSESNTSSMLATSSESIDENQNQTPSQKNRYTKKILNYVTPNMKINMQSPGLPYTSPILRTGLKEKIDNIIEVDGTPNLHSLKRNNKKSTNINEVSVSTPRNLFHDFCDNDDRPCTPENMVHIIPESMSAIKKSHKKERLARQLDHVAVHEMEVLLNKVDTDRSTDFQVEKRPSTPPMNEKCINSIYNVNCIKQSHKKDKDKKKSFVQHSEDELSDTGSIFDYSESQEPILQKESSDVIINREEDDYTLKTAVQLYKETHNVQVLINKEQLKLQEHDHHESAVRTSVMKNDCNEQKHTDCSELVNIHSSVLNNPSPEHRPVTPETRERSIDIPETPENHFNYLQHVLTESIKKSHRKVKDENRKRIFKPKNLHDKLEDENLDVSKYKDKFIEEVSSENNDNFIINNTDRATTPENINSSRLLLSLYSSVKKSHKKDKHDKMISGFMKRQNNLKKTGNFSKTCQSDIKEFDNSSKCDVQETGLSICNTEITDYDSQCENITESSNIDTGFRLCNNNAKYCCKLSPSKRKVLNDETSQINIPHTPNSSESSSLVECSSVDEFKIFTPIKKRKSLHTHSDTKCSQHNTSSLIDREEQILINTDISRCMTPVINHYENIESLESVTAVNQSVSKEPENNFSYIPRANVQNEDSEKPNGRSTPKNTLTADLLFDINSIKKSHKKDKRGTALQRALILNQEEFHVAVNNNEHVTDDMQFINELPSCSFKCIDSETNSTQISLLKKNNSEQTFLKSVDYNDPQPSTSKMSIESNDMENTHKDQNASNVTPPNCVKLKNYITLQTTSIKKSHKKVRERRKQNLMSYSPELMDNNSSFDKEEKSIENVQDYSDIKHEISHELHAVQCTDCSDKDITPLNTSLQNEIHQSDYTSSYYSLGNLSDDGSIFSTDEKLDDILNVSSDR